LSLVGNQIARAPFGGLEGDLVSTAGTIGKFRVGDLLVSFRYIYVITERDEGKENEVPVVMTTGFYRWNDRHVEWETTTWAEALARPDLVNR
jgi:hypothetical protein